MVTVTDHQAEAARLLALAGPQARAGDFVRAAYTLERALSHAAAAAGGHWQTFPNPTHRQIGHILAFLAYDGHISHNSARSFHQFKNLHHSIAKAQAAGSPAARRTRRTLRNSHRRVARIINSVNHAIAANPNPTPTPNPIHPCH